jgi:hypothetical protein
MCKTFVLTHKFTDVVKLLVKKAIDGQETFCPEEKGKLNE